jgi:hypothetical protein
VDGGGKTILLIGDEAESRDLLHGLFAVLAVEERLRLTFSTHFYESDHLRSLFALATVRSRAEAPSPRENYLLFDLEEGEFPALSPTSAYARWLAEGLRSGWWEEIHTLNAVLNWLRRRPQGAKLPALDERPQGARLPALDERPQGARLPLPMPHSPLSYRALWERAGVKVAQVLWGNPSQVYAFLPLLPSPRPLADALLAASPSELCGEETTPEVVIACLAALRSAATPKVWQTWVKRWEQEPWLIPFRRDAQPWWQRFFKRKEPA